MKNLKLHLTFTILAFTVMFQSLIFADNECPIAEWYPNLSIPPDFIGGYLKPHRTDSAEGEALPLTASMNVIIVFVQFPDEDTSSNNNEWPVGQPPIYINTLLAPERENSGSFWSRYDETNERVSDYYQEVSRGKFHMTGITRHYIFDHPRSWYNSNPTLINNEVYMKLQNDEDITWRNYDQWTYLSAGNFRYDGDGNLDMLMMVRRTNPGYAGFAGLDGSNFEIDPENHIWIRTDFDHLGSGLVIQGNMGNPHPYNKFLGILLHEYGHFLFGPHSTIGIMTSRGGNSIHDLFTSPFEKLKLGYLSDTLVNFVTSSNYSIADISSRTSDKNVLKIPISTSEYFLIENRRKVSTYDVKMLGDTNRLNMFMNSAEYGKGVYIYHHRSIDLNYPGDQDEECADGLWNWGVSGTADTDWGSTLPLLKRSSMANPVNNDDGYWGNLTNKDDVSANYTGGDGVYFSVGKRNATVGLCGIDKLFTNEKGNWTSRAQWGDRWDAWNLGYNEIFSPYSNPNTKTFNHSNSGIFIYYSSLTNGVASINVYKTGEPYTLDTILYYTPPSKPMGIVADYYLEGENIMRPRITWNHNMEPDMLSDSLTKRYKIWRATHANMANVPVNYYLIAVLDIDSGTVPEYIDTSIIGYGSAWPGMGEQIEYPVRYKVQAIDKHQDSSVRSDFGSAIGLLNCTVCANEPRPYFNEQGDIPDEYSLDQNYPNPFNPVTRICYAIPVEGFVTLKIYDVLGKEVMTLVNDSKQAGYYETEFSESNLASGLYFYTIKSGSFKETKRMLLIK